MTVVLATGCGSADEAAPPAEAGVPAGPTSELTLRTPATGPTTTLAMSVTPPTLSEGATTTSPPATEATVPPDDTAAPADTAPPADPGAPADGEAVAADPMAPVPEEELIAGEERSATMLNELRTGGGLEPMARNPEMDTFAREWSRHMAETGEFAHSTGAYGENIAFTSETHLTAAEAAERFHELWVNSPDHLANMVSAQVASTGVGLYRTERGWYGTQVFLY
jgi:uncharacterized protein YkwD